LTGPALVLIALLLTLVAPPLWFVVSGSVMPDDGGGITLRYYQNLISNPGLLRSVLNSLLFAVFSAIAALLIGGLNAWIVERTDTPFKSLITITTVTALAIPYVLYTSAWLQLLGRAGPINQLYRALSGSDGVLFDVYSLPGMVLIEGLLWSPFVFLAFSAALRNMNPEFEEAARMSGARTVETLRSVTLGLLMPAILALAMLLFVRAIEAFEVPALVGIPGCVYTMTTDIYSDMQQSVPPDLGGASAFSVVLIALVAVLLRIHDKLTKNADRFATVTGKGFRSRVIVLGRWRYLTASVLVLNFVLLLALPMAMLVWVSLLPFAQAIGPRAFQLVSLRNYVTVLESPDNLELVQRTIVIAALTATAAMTLTALASWLVIRRATGAKLLAPLTTMPLVFPGIVLGVGVMQLFLRVPLPIYGTIWILIWAFVIAYLPYGMRYCFAGLLQIHRELEEASALAGAAPFATLRRITLPLLSPSLIAGWLFIFLVSARVLSLAILLAGPSSQTLAVAMFGLWTNGQGNELAALGLMWAAAVSVVIVLFHAVSRRARAGFLRLA